MSHHKFTTPRVVYLGQAYRGQGIQAPRGEGRLPRAEERRAAARGGGQAGAAARTATR